MIGVILLAVMLFFGWSAFKKHYTLKQIKEIPAQEEAQPKDEPESDEDEQKTEKKKDPVKEFISEKAENAMKRFFTKELEIVAIGDSLTEGIGDEMNNGGYVGILTDTINQDRDLVEIENYGKQGNRTDQLIARLEDAEITASLKEADIILITIGANDIMRIFKENFTNLTLDKFSSEQESYEDRLHEIFTTMRSLNSRANIYLIGFYNPFERYFADIEELEIIVDNWNSIGEEVTTNYENVHYIPTKDLFEDTTIDYLSDDNFHPNHLGYELMAERILEYLTNEGEPVDEEE